MFCSNCGNRLAGLTNLNSLVLSHNEISDWSPVDHVEDVRGRP